MLFRSPVIANYTNSLHLAGQSHPKQAIQSAGMDGLGDNYETASSLNTRVCAKYVLSRAE